MIKKITLATVADKLEKMDTRIGQMDTRIGKMDTRMVRGFASVEARMEKGFAAVADDMNEIRQDMATKAQVISLHTQVNSIESELRGVKKLEPLVLDLKDKVFGKTRR